MGSWESQRMLRHSVTPFRASKNQSRLQHPHTVELSNLDGSVCKTRLILDVGISHNGILAYRIGYWHIAYWRWILAYRIMAYSILARRLTCQGNTVSVLLGRPLCPSGPGARQDLTSSLNRRKLLALPGRPSSRQWPASKS